MKCNRFKIELLRNQEWFQFYTDFKTAVSQFDSAILGIDALFANFLVLYNSADEVLEMIRKSATTEQIADADTNRDGTFRGLIDAIKSALNHFDPAKREAAKRLQIVVNTYGNLARKSYDEETASIYNFLQELNGDYAANITLLALNDWVVQLEADNKTFDTLMQNRYTEGSGKTNLRMQTIRLDTDRCYRDMLDRLDALMLINGDEVYAPFVNELNARSLRYENILAQRKGRAAAKKNKADNESDTQ